MTSSSLSPPLSVRVTSGSGSPLSAQILEQIESLAWNEQGLLPAIVQDYLDGTVLMVAWVNREALHKSLSSGRTWFWSRSRQALWPKGDTSGHVQWIQSVRVDCDRDALLFQVEQVGGVACHTGSRSCFFGALPLGSQNGESLGDTDQGYSDARPSGDPVLAQGSGDQKHISSVPLGDTLSQVFSVIKDRQANPQPESYTNKLLAKGDNAILKKLGEETAEVVMAVKDQDPEAIASEVADLWYHCLVALAHHHVDIQDVYRKLQARRGKTPQR